MARWPSSETPLELPDDCSSERMWLSTDHDKHHHPSTAIFRHQCNHRGCTIHLLPQILVLRTLTHHHLVWVLRSQNGGGLWLLLVTKFNFTCQKFLFYKPMPIDYKCRGMYTKVMLKIETCGKSLNVFNEVIHVKMWFFSKSVSCKGSFP